MFTLLTNLWKFSFLSYFCLEDVFVPVIKFYIIKLVFDDGFIDIDGIDDHHR